MTIKPEPQRKASESETMWLREFRKSQIAEMNAAKKKAADQKFLEESAPAQGEKE